jgi:hypothetical protein
VSKNQSIYDPDLVNYYEPISKNLYSYYSPNAIDDHLSAQVTPIFPIFLRLLQNRTNAMLAIVLLSFIILFLVYFISTKLLPRDWTLVPVLILSIEPSFYAASLNLAPEIIYSTALVAGVYFAVYQPFPNHQINSLLFCFFIGISVTIRPIAIVLVAFVFVAYFYRMVKNLTAIYFLSATVLVLPSVAWSMRNYFEFGFFNVSSISAHNLLWYEGVPAFANENNLTFEEATTVEFERKRNFLGSDPNVIDNYTYNKNRGYELMIEHPKGLLISHIYGIPKILFGIFKSKFYIILNYIYNINGELVVGIIFAIFGMCVLFIWILFLVGMKSTSESNFLVFALFALITVSSILPASGQVAYARFRSPIMPFVCIISAIGLVKLKESYLKKKNEVNRRSLVGRPK